MSDQTRPQSRIARPLLGGLAAAALLIAACSGAATPSPTAVAQSAAPPSSTQSTAPSAASALAASPSAAASETYEVTVATDAKLGKYLAGEDGKTLYVFKKDTANTSNCSGGCAQTWPPFVLEAGEQVEAAAGVTGTLTTFARADGPKQVAYNGTPLYYFASDAKAGDVMGQGIGNVWFAAKP
jgi:predicted lipoprotein with Yx(FWY)xxD motif